MRKRGTFFGVSGLLLGGLEKMMDGNFVCPCKSGENELQTAYYAFIPFFGCFILTFFCVKMPDETKIKNKCTCKRFLFSTIIAFIWLVFFFIDGRYVICALAGWDKGLTCQSTGEIEFKKADPTTKTYLIISKVRSVLKNIFYKQ